MGQQRVKALTAEVGGSLISANLEGEAPMRACPLRAMGVECSPDAVLPTPPAHAFGEMAAAFPSDDQIRRLGGLPMALAAAGQPVPSILCCEQPVVSPVNRVVWC